jgi:hypothetical protein
MSRTQRRRARTQARENLRATTVVDANLLDATTRLGDAVAALTAGQAHPLPGAGSGWLPSRYVMLRGALCGTRGGGGRKSQPSSMIPCWVDALKLLITIDDRAAELERWHRGRCAGCPVCRHLADRNGDHPTVRRVCALPDYPWRPQDSRALLEITGELDGYAKAIDDLFAPKPIYLPDPCPQCGQSATYRFTDDGQRVRTSALAVTAEHGAVCQSCHVVWPPDQLVFLGRILGTGAAGIPA